MPGCSKNRVWEVNEEYCSILKNLTSRFNSGEEAHEGDKEGAKWEESQECLNPEVEEGQGFKKDGGVNILNVSELQGQEGREASIGLITWGSLVMLIRKNSVD